MPVMSFSRVVGKNFSVFFDDFYDILRGNPSVPLPEIKVLPGGLTDWSFRGDGLFDLHITGAGLGRNVSGSSEGRGALANESGPITSISLVFFEDKTVELAFEDVNLSPAQLILAASFPNSGGAGFARMLMGLPDLEINGTSGNDKFTQSLTTQFADLNLSGDNVIRLRGGDDAINAGAGNDKVFGGGGRDVIHGGAGRDQLDGGGGRDRVDGGGGRDRIDGGTGNERLTGGGGADVFVLRANRGHDVVTDFKIGVDVIDVPRPRAVTIDGTSAGVEISFGGASLVLLGVTESAFLHSHDTLII